MKDISPAGITVNKGNNELVIAWNDSHTSEYSFSLLRFACPCADCRGGHDQMSAEPPGEVFYMQAEDSLATRLKKIENIGNYGITIEWEDGHHFGIYNWHYLRALCPCSICREMTIYGQ